MRAPISQEELARRNQLSTRYKNGKKLDLIEDQIRGIRTTINILITKEKELQEEKKRLSPIMREAV